MLSLDFETRSRVDLRKVGAWQYAMHPSTEVLCAAWAYGGGEPRLWYPPKFERVLRSDPLDILLKHVEETNKIGAFNATFEFLIWNYQMTKIPNVPKLPIEKFACSAALARHWSLPKSLDDVAKALGLTAVKDKEGAGLMRIMCKPQKDGTWVEDLDSMRRLGAYCRQDVRVEQEIVKRLPPMSERERKIWIFDQKVNARGVPIDVEFVKAVVPALEREEAIAKERIAWLSGGAVTSPTQTQRIAAWLGTPDTQKDTLAKLIKDSAVSAERKEAAKIRLIHGLASVKKYHKLLDMVGTDGRVRGTLLYSGASRTRRWTGVDFQPQNIVKGYKDPEMIEQIVEAFKQGDTDFIDLIWGPVTLAASKVLRSAICAPPGRSLLVSDFSSIEAIVTAVVTGTTELVDAFRRGRDAYRITATKIYPSMTYEDVKKESKERDLGKVATLGLGYGMGVSKFHDTAGRWGVPISTDLAEAVVAAYRGAYSSIPATWTALERDLLNCIMKQRSCKRDFWGFEPHELGVMMTLPNGSKRLYYKARVAMREKFGKVAPCITYQGYNQMSGGGQTWGWVDTYGGKILENLVQGTAREIQCDTCLAVDALGVQQVMQVHDEVVNEIDESSSFGVQDLERTMASASSGWASDWPISASGGWKGKRFRK